MPHPSSVPDSSARKRVLFCPRCGHASHVDGDWLVRNDDGRSVYVCPDCDAEITTRPRSSPGAL